MCAAHLPHTRAPNHGMARRVFPYNPLTQRQNALAHYNTLIHHNTLTIVVASQSIVVGEGTMVSEGIMAGQGNVPREGIGWARVFWGVRAF